MSTRTSVQRLQKTPDIEIAESHVEPGAGRGPQAREVAIAARKRFQLGIFIRKIVDGKVEKEWQFPPVKWRAVREIDGHVPRQGGAEEGEPGSGDGGTPLQGQAFALRSSDGGGGGSDSDLGEVTESSKGTGDTGPIHETRYEVGAFFGAVTTTTDSDSDDS